MLTQYRYLAAVVDHGGVSAAARALGLSQPAITRSLQALEFHLDTVLLDRCGGVPVLTPAGRLVLDRARVLLAEQRSLVDDVAALRAGEDVVTYVNGSPMTAIALLPRILVRMATQFPDFRVSVRGDNGANYQWKRDALLAGDLDVAITILDPSIHDDGLIYRPLFDPVLKVVVRSDHPGVGSHGDLEALLPYRWIMPPAGSSPRAVVENEFRARGLLPPRNAIEISDWRIALDLVLQTDCVTAIPYHPACFDDRFARFQILDIPFRVRPLGLTLVTRPTTDSRQPTATLVAVSQTIVREFSP